MFHTDSVKTLTSVLLYKKEPASRFLWTVTTLWNCQLAILKIGFAAGHACDISVSIMFEKQHVFTDELKSKFKMTQELVRAFHAAFNLGLSSFKRHVSHL